MIKKNISRIISFSCIKKRRFLTKDAPKKGKKKQRLSSESKQNEKKGKNTAEGFRRKVKNGKNRSKSADETFGGKCRAGKMN